MTPSEWFCTLCGTDTKFVRMQKLGTIFTPLCPACKILFLSSPVPVKNKM